MKNDLELKWDKREQAFIDRSSHASKERAEKRNAEEYLDFLSEIGREKGIPPITRLRDKQFVL